jgi:hypothetical protein
MSFITNAFNWITGSSLGAKLARTAATAFALNRVTASINRENEAVRSAETSTTNEEVDNGTRVTINPNPEASIPVFYGAAVTGGITTDAYLSSDNLTMTVVYVLSEKTGTIFSNGLDSEFQFVGVDINDNFLRFKADGITVNDALSPSGEVYTNLDGLIEIYFYDGNSESPRAPLGYESSSGGLPFAYEIIDDWDSTYMMENLVFAVCKVTYNAEKKLTGLPDFKFLINNSMFKVGDVLYDYMTNDIYGGSIPEEEIYRT